MDLLPISFYALGTLLVMVVMAIVNSKLEVDMAKPDDAGPLGLPLFFAHAWRDFLDLGLVTSNQRWVENLHRHFGEGEDLVRAGDELRALGRPGMSLLAAATTGFTLGYGWKAEEIAPHLREAIREKGLDLACELEQIEALPGGVWRGRLTVGPWSRTLEFRVPGDVYREANTVLEPEGFRIMQFATGSLTHAFALMHLPLARQMYQMAVFDLVDPPGGEDLVPGGTTERWYSWLY